MAVNTGAQETTIRCLTDNWMLELAFRILDAGSPVRERYPFFSHYREAVSYSYYSYASYLLGRTRSPTVLASARRFREERAATALLQVLDLTIIADEIIFDTPFAEAWINLPGSIPLREAGVLMPRNTGSYSRTAVSPNQ